MSMLNRLFDTLTGKSRKAQPVGLTLRQSGILHEPPSRAKLKRRGLRAWRIGQAVVQCRARFNALGRHDCSNCRSFPAFGDKCIFLRP